MTRPRRVNLIPMAGAGKRFSEAGYALPKPLIPVAGIPMIARALSSLPPADATIFVCLEEHVRREKVDALLREISPGAEIVVLPKLSRGQLDSCLAARELLRADDQLTIGPCDAAVEYGDRESMWSASPGADAMIWTFRNNPVVVRNPEMYGWVEPGEDGFARRVSVKVPLSTFPLRDHAVVGAFSFRRAADFLDCADAAIEANRRVGNEFYVDEVMNVVIERGLKVAIFEVDKYDGFGTPADLSEFEHTHSAPSLSIVIPCYNEANNLPHLVRRLAEVIGARRDVEVVLVDNGSTDESASVLRRLAGEPRNSFARICTVERNEGYGNGILRGLDSARGEYLGWTHADLQTDPQDVIAGFDDMRRRPDAHRIFLKGRRTGRRAVDAAFTAAMSIIATAALRSRLTDVNAQPKLFHRSFLRELAGAPKDFSLDLFALLRARRAGLHVMTRRVSFEARRFGEAKGGGGPSLRGKARLARATLARIFSQARTDLRGGAG